MFSSDVRGDLTNRVLALSASECLTLSASMPKEIEMGSMLDLSGPCAKRVPTKFRLST